MLYGIQELSAIMIIARNNTTFSNTDKLPKGLKLQSSFSNSSQWAIMPKYSWRKHALWIYRTETDFDISFFQIVSRLDHYGFSHFLLFVIKRMNFKMLSKY